MKFTLNVYPNATYDADAEIWDMGATGELLDTYEVDSPAQMRQRLPQRAEYLEQDDIVHAWREPSGRIVGVRVES